ncbi:MAG: hypothetical protein AABZ60_23860 [Planctomycetota bacterium]
MRSSCLECGSQIEISEQIQSGELADCENCGVSLEILSSNPLALAVFEEEEK